MQKRLQRESQLPPTVTEGAAHRVHVGERGEVGNGGFRSVSALIWLLVSERRAGNVLGVLPHCSFIICARIKHTLDGETSPSIQTSSTSEAQLISVRCLSNRPQHAQK